MAHDPVLTFGAFRLDPGTESVWRGSEEIRFRPKTFAVLRYLAERPARLITKEELLEAVWPEVAVGDAALTVCVGEIRKALGDEAKTPRFIETVHRRGYRFIGLVQVNAAGEALPSPLAEFVGREAELRRLRRWLERALQGERQVGFVTGEAGIGKTALVETFLSAISPSDGRVGRGQCLEHYGAGEAYLPVLEALGRLARGPGSDRVVAVLGRHAPTWLGQMPGLLSAEDMAALQPRIAGTTRERMLREMAEAIETLTAELPLVLVLEDLHWSDHSTLDLIAAVARRGEPARLLLVGTYRPHDVSVRGHPLGAVTQELALHRACEELLLGPLGEDDVGRYLAVRVGSEAGARLTPTVHRRTDGLPLFMVNVVDALTHHGLLVETADGWEVKGDDAEMETAVPESLRQMIEQQLARLAPDEQRLLEAASVAGLGFSAAAVAAALDESVEAVEDRCEALARRQQFIHACGVEEWPDGTVAAGYQFLHVLYQQVLDERLPAARRASLHLRVGERKEAGYRSRVGERAAALAVHFERGRDASRATRYRRLAAEQALRRCAYPEALEHLTRGQELLDRVPDASERLALECDMQTTLGPTLFVVRGPAAPEVEAAYLRARELAERLGDSTRLYPALWGLWYVNYGRSRYSEARELGEKLLALAQQGNDTARLLEAHHALWPTLTAMGAPAAVQAHLERGLALYDSTLHRAQVSLYSGHDTGVCCRIHLALTQWRLGYPDRALGALRDAIGLDEKLAHPMTSILTLCFAAWVHWLRGEYGAARENGSRLAALAAAQGARTYASEGAAILACVEVAEAPDRRRVGELYKLLVSVQGARTAWRSVISFCLLAEAAGDIGDVAGGLEALAAIPEEHRAMFFAPEIERVRGELLARRPARSEAERCLRRAVETAGARGERSLELRAATSLARFLAHEDRHGEARSALAGIYGWFTEGYDTGDLREARSVLEELTRAG